jgi:DNA-binding ferritin-like protein
MLQNIKNDNDKFLATLVVAYDEAEKASEFGVSNYIQDRIQAHEKHAWMLRAITK